MPEFICESGRSYLLGLTNFNIVEVISGKHDKLVSYFILADLYCFHLTLNVSLSLLRVNFTHYIITSI